MFEQSLHSSTPLLIEVNSGLGASNDKKVASTTVAAEGVRSLEHDRGQHCLLADFHCTCGIIIRQYVASIWAIPLLYIIVLFCLRTIRPGEIVIDVSGVTA